MIDRRAFFELVAGATLGAVARPLAALAAPATRAAGAGLPGIASDHPGVDPIGVQLYTVRSLMTRDFEGTLARVAEIGYREVEFAGYFGRSPAQVRAALERVGLAAPAAHVGLDAVRQDWDRTLDAAREIGHRYLIVAWLPDGERRTLDGYRRLADEFDRAGERARELGLRFGYHNHDFEFAPIDGRVPYDVLVEATDPARVALELDLFWVTRGGGDPLDYFRRYPGRFELVHVKDMDGTAARGMVDVGQGVIDFRAIFARAAQAGIRHRFVEHDQPADPIESIRRSYAYLEGMTA